MIMSLGILATVIGATAFVLYKLYTLLALLYSIQNATDTYGRQLVKLNGEVDRLGHEISDFSNVLKTSEMKLEHFAPDCYWAKIEALKIFEEILHKNHVASTAKGDDNVSNRD